MSELIYQPSLIPDAWKDCITVEADPSDPSISHGEVFTRPWVVEMILDLAGYVPEADLASQRAVEPACGSGAFLVPIAQRLSTSCRLYGRPITDALHAIHAVDLMQPSVEIARRAVAKALEADGWPIDQAESLAIGWIHAGDFILGPDHGESADFVLGNPPYVRPEDMAPAALRAYRTACPTMGGRADLFIAFFEKGLRALKAGGTLGFICADRWMHNQYGGKLREMIAARFSVDATIVMHDVDAFEEEVSAYPAVSIIRRKPQGPALVAGTTARFGPEAATAIVRWADGRRSAPKRTEAFQVAELPHWFTGSEGWPGGNPERLALMTELADRFPPLERNGTRVRIGVATGADGIFVTKDADLVEPERLLPLSMVRDTKADRFEWSGHYLVDPWDSDDKPAKSHPRGGLVDLREWPQLNAYFEAHGAALRGRKRNLTSWYQTIDRVDHSITKRPKLLFPDMKMTSRPVYEAGGFYPHHNLYYIVSDEWPLEVLGGLLLSQIADLFIRAYAVKMRGGTQRFQAQYLRRIRVPELKNVGPADQKALAEAFEARDVERATGTALKLYGLSASTLAAVS
jgi:hypothetical protein